MALNYKTGGNGADFEPVAAGTHFGVCTAVVDVGLQPGSAMYPKPKRLLFLRFDIPAERTKTTDGHDAPAIIYERFTASMNKKALLRAALEGWRGRAFTDSEAEEFDIAAVLGKAATITVVHNKSGDKTYANIASLGLLPKGMPPPQAENDLLLYYPGKEGQISKLPKFLQEKIANQIVPETGTSATDREADSRADEFVDDDIPF